MQEILKNCMASNGQIFNRNSWDKSVMYKTLAFITSKTMGLDVHGSLSQEQKETGKLFSSNTSLDLDSIIITMKGMSPEFRQYITKKATECELAGPDSNPVYVESTNELWQSLQIDWMSQAIFQTAKSKNWITEPELFLVTKLDNQRCLSVSSDHLKRKLVRLPTVGYHANCSYLYSLPFIDHSTEPIHSWVRVQEIRIFMQCMRRIAWQFNQHYQCSSNYDNAKHLVADCPNSRNLANSVGGLWLHRLAFLLYQMMQPSDLIATYVEETFNMKTKTMSVRSTWKEFNMNSADADPNIQMNLFDDCLENMTSGRVSEELAGKLNTTICRYGAPLNMLRFYFLGICEGVINYGLGLQTEAVKVYDNGSIALMYPYVSSHFHTEEGRGANVVQNNYPTLGLCNGLSGSTGRLSFDAEINSNDRDVSVKRRGGAEKREMPDYITAILERMWPKASAPPLSSASHCVLLRSMNYNTSIRHAAGGSDLPYDKRNSTLIKIQAEADSTSKDPKGKKLGHVSVSYYARKIEDYSKQVGDTIAGIGKHVGQRSELAFLVNGYVDLSPSPNVLSKSKKTTLWKDDTFDDDCFKKGVLYSIKEPIRCALGKVKANSYLKASDVVDYVFMNVNGYLCAYNLGLLALNDIHLKPNDRESVSEFMCYVHCFLAVFYTGSSRAEYTGSGIYKPKVYLPKFGIKLNRPFGICPPFPSCILNVYNQTTQMPSLAFELIKGSKYVLTHRFESNESRMRKNLAESVLLHGSKDGNKVFVCNHEDCEEKYFRTSDALFYHLDEMPSHGSCYSKDENVAVVTTDIAKAMIDFIKRDIPEEFLPVLNDVMDGKNVTISGNGGTGKSYFLRQLLKCMHIIHDDWLLDKESKRPTKVHGICSQQLQAQNISCHFVTMHSFCGITDTEVPDYDNEIELIKHCKEKLASKSCLKQKLRDMEVLFVDEYGMFPEYYGTYLRMLIRVARGMEDAASNLASYGGDDDYDSEDDDQVESMSRAYDPQFIYCGQALQMPPIINGRDSKDPRYRTMALSPYIINSSVPHHVTKAYRIDSTDPSVSVLLQLLDRAKYGTFTIDDVDIIAKSGRITRELMSSVDNILDVFKVVHLFFLKAELRKAVPMWMASIARRFPKKKCYEVHGIHRVAYSQSQKEDVFFDHKCLFTGKTVAEKCVLNKQGGMKKKNGYTNDDQDLKETDPFFQEELKTPHLHKLFIDMPVVLSDKMPDHELILLGKNGKPTVPEQKRCITIAKNTQVVIKYIHATPDVVPEEQYITVQVKLITENGVFRDFLFDLKRKETTCACKVGASFGTLSRFQFPFTNGLCMSWSIIQGMTLPYVNINMSLNKHLYASTHNFPALWHVTLGRVKSLDGINVGGLDEKLMPGNRDTMKALMRKFFCCVIPECVAFERSYIQAALHEKEGKNRLVPKVAHPLVFLEHEKPTSAADKGFRFGELKSRSKESEINLDKLKECRVTLAKSIKVLAKAIKKALTTVEKSQLNVSDAVRRFYSTEMATKLDEGTIAYDLMRKNGGVYLAGDDKNLIIDYFSMMRMLCELGVVATVVTGLDEDMFDGVYIPDFVPIFPVMMNTSSAVSTEPRSASLLVPYSIQLPRRYPIFKFVNDLDPILVKGVLERVEYALAVANVDVPDVMSQEMEVEVGGGAVTHSKKRRGFDTIPDAARCTDGFAFTVVQKRVKPNDPATVLLPSVSVQPMMSATSSLQDSSPEGIGSAAAAAECCSGSSRHSYVANLSASFTPMGAYDADASQTARGTLREEENV